MSTRLSPDLLRWVAALLFAACAGSALAADAMDLRADRERQRAANERRRVEADYAARVKGCEAQFVVTSCMEQAKAERRQALDRLRQQQAVMDDALRKQRAAERLEQLQEKQQAAAARRNAPVQPPRVVKRGAQAASAADAASAAGASGTAHATHPGALQLPQQHEPTVDEQARKQSAFEQRQESAAAHRAAVEKRNAQRAAGHKPSASLPVPSVIPASSAEAPAPRPAAPK
jgi:hypothetical protein